MAFDALFRNSENIPAFAKKVLFLFTEINFQELPDVVFSSGEKDDITQAWRE